MFASYFFSTSLFACLTVAWVSPTSPMPEAKLWGAPSIMHAHDGYWSFATNTGGCNVPFAFSSNFTDWSVVKDKRGRWVDAMPTKPAWANQEQAAIWDPDVAQLDDGRYILYFSASTQKEGNHCMGVAYATNITGPYIPEPRPLFCPSAPDQTIDPNAFQDPVTKRRYIVYKYNMRDKERHPGWWAAYKGNDPPPGSRLPLPHIPSNCPNDIGLFEPTPIMLQEVSPVDGVTFIGHATGLVNNNGREDMGNTEAPSLMYDAESGNYILFFASGCYLDSSYRTNYAVSTTGIEGPYVRNPEPIFATGVPAGANLIGPGTFAVLNSGKLGVMFSHSYANQTDPRMMRTAFITVKGTTVSA